MKSKKTIIAGSVFMIALLMGGVIYAFGPHHRSPMIEEFIKFKVDQMLAELNLTEDQKAQTDIIREKLRDEIHALMQRKQESHKEFFELLRTDNPDKKLLKSMIDENLEATRTKLYTVTDLMLEFHDTLNPAQRELLFEKLDEMHAKKDHPHKWHH
jgi:Spy/CpxP family protein refolding chaperone